MQEAYYCKECEWSFIPTAVFLEEQQRHTVCPVCGNPEIVTLKEEGFVELIQKIAKTLREGRANPTNAFVEE